MGRFQRDTPPAKTCAMPRACFSLNYQRLRISRQPSIYISAPTLGSRPPRHGLSQSTAEIVWLCNRVLSPTRWGSTLASAVNAFAATNMAINNIASTDEYSPLPRVIEGSSLCRG